MTGGKQRTTRRLRAPVKLESEVRGKSDNSEGGEEGEDIERGGREEEKNAEKVEEEGERRGGLNIVNSMNRRR